MEFTCITKLPELTGHDTLVLPVWSDEIPALAKVEALGTGVLASLWNKGSIKVKAGEVKTLYLASPWSKVIMLGMGDAVNVASEKAEQARQSGAALAKELAKSPDGKALLVIDELGHFGDEAIGALVEGVILGGYDFTKYRTVPAGGKSSQTVQIVGPQEIDSVVRQAVILAEAVNLARDLVNEPANTLTPRELARQVGLMADKHNLQCQVIGRKEMTQLGMGGLVGIAQGSAEPPQLIVLSYQGCLQTKKIGLVGKGVTFDAGGISLKPAKGMDDMKSDMAGGAAVVAALIAIARLQLKVNVVGIIPATENMPGGSALKPGDIVKMSDGTTVEVVNTDAE